MLLEAEIKEVKPFKAAIDTLCSLVPEGVFEFSPQGVETKTFDPCQIVFVNMKIPKEFFEKYNIKAPKVLVPTSITEFNKILSRCSETRIGITVSGTHMKVTSAEESVLREFKLPLLDISEETVTPNPPKEGVRLIVKSEQFRKAVKDACLFSDSILLVASEEMLILEAKGSGGQVRTIIKGDADFLEKGEAESRYSLSYLSNIVKNVPKDERIEICFSHNSPLLINFKLERITFSFLLAHMII